MMGKPWENITISSQVNGGVPIVTIATSSLIMLLGNFIKPTNEISVLEDIAYGNMLNRSNFKLKHSSFRGLLWTVWCSSLNTIEHVTFHVTMTTVS